MVNLTSLSLSIDPIDRLRLHSIQALLMLIILGGLFNGWLLLNSGESLVQDGSVIVPVSIIIASALFVFVSRGYYTTLIGSFAVFYLISISFYSFSNQFNLLIMMFMIALISAALVTPFSIYAVFNALVLILAMSTVFIDEVHVLDENVQLTKSLTQATSVAFALLPLGIGGIMRYIFDTLEKNTTESQRTAALLEASANIGQNVSQMLHLHELLEHAAEIIRDRFAFYQVQIFLLNEDSTFANLVASPGEVGEKLLKERYRIPIDASTVIGRVILSREAIIARNTDIDRDKTIDNFSQNIRSELAIPIQDNEGVIGVIEIRSRLSDAFTQIERRVLTVIANQLATAIRNARLFERQATNLSENKRLFIESETNLREIQRLNRQLTRQAWSDYLLNHEKISGVIHDGEDFEQQAEWTQQMRDASRRRRPISHDEQAKRIVSVPIELRGEVIGAIEVETQHTEHFDDSVDLMQAISQRLAISLDHARLFEEIQETSAQEQRVSELVAQFQSADTVDDLLRITLEGLSEALGAQEGAIRLGFLAETLDHAIAPESRDTPEGASS